jgi:hypothetical protein
MKFAIYKDGYLVTFCRTLRQARLIVSKLKSDDVAIVKCNPR